MAKQVVTGEWKADNNAGPTRRSLQRLASTRADFHHGPGASSCSITEVADTFAVRSVFALHARLRLWCLLET
jgi:hypothetical protein